MKNLNATAKFKLNKTIVTRFTRLANATQPLSTSIPTSITDVPTMTMMQIF